MLGRPGEGPPVYTYETVPGVPLVSAMRLGPGFSEVRPGAHSHDFLVLNYFEEDGGSLRLGDKEWQIQAGDVYLIAPGEVADASGLEEAEGWGVFFPPESHAGSRVARRQRSLVQPPLFAHHTGRSSAPQRHRRPHLLRDGHATVRLSPHRRG
jgi:AraC family transcriptional activator of pobA